MYGVGDFGSLTMTELIEFAGRMAGVVDIPVVGDADDGGETWLNVHRTIQTYSGSASPPR
jgi:2-methylisocitrate lyase-like PEP mutase family enzyme